MTGFINNIIEDLKNNSSICYKAWPSDITFYKIDITKNQALISWQKTNQKQWFNLDKICFCCKSWLYGDDSASSKCDQYYAEFVELTNKKEARI